MSDKEKSIMPNYLSVEQINQYERDGVVFPVCVLSPSEAAKFRTAFEELEAQLGGRLSYAGWPHLHFPWAYELATHPAIADAVEGVLGPDVVILSSLLLCKYPRDPDFASWHQDGTYSGTHRVPSTSAWIALGESTAENGCMRVLPGSHRQGMHSHTNTYAKNNILKRGPQIEMEVDESQARDVCLQPGEMSLHHNNIVHGSNPNRAESKRIGFIVRFTTTDVKQAVAPVIQVRGQKDCRHLTHLQEPPQGTLRKQIAAWTAFNREREKAG